MDASPTALLRKTPCSQVGKILKRISTILRKGESVSDDHNVIKVIGK